MRLNKIFFILQCIAIAILSINLIDSASSSETNKLSTKEVKMNSDEIYKFESPSFSHNNILFGHQSVGSNIIEGIEREFIKTGKLKIQLVNSQPTVNNAKGFFIHLKVGKNGDPMSKTSDFIKIIDGINCRNIDLAFHKYCYLDINVKSDIDAIFNNYVQQMEKVQQQCQNTKFIHITVPLTTIQKGWKAYIKKIIGKPISGELPNTLRNEFNSKILNYYGKNDLVFDLAKIEATDPEGKLTTFKYNGKEYLTMYEGYSDDGGHLNLTGQSIVASELIKFLIHVLEKNN